MESVKDLFEKLTGMVESEIAKERDDLKWLLDENAQSLDEWRSRAEKAEAELLQARKQPAEGRFTLAWLQKNLPWTIPYSEAFHDSQGREGHRNFTHDLLRLMKSLGQLAAHAERRDHRTEHLLGGMNAEKAFRNTIASLVICALHMSNENPFDTFDLEKAVVEHLESRNSVKLDPDENASRVCGSRAPAPNFFVTCNRPKGHELKHVGRTPLQGLLEWPRSVCGASKQWERGEVIHCTLGDGHAGDHQNLEPGQSVRGWANLR